MNKSLKRIIIILAAFSILSFIVLIIVQISVKEKEKRNALEAEKLFIYSFDSDSISRLNIKNEDGEYHFKYTADDGWKIEKPDNEFRFNPYLLNEIVVAMSELNAVSIVTEDAGDLSIYGLDEPKLISCFLTDSQEYSLEIGSHTAANNGYYVKKPNENTVYVIDYYTGLSFSTSRIKLKDLYLFDTLASKMTGITLERGGDLVYKLIKDETGWVMKEPLDTSRLNFANISETVETIIRVNVSGYAVEDITPDRYAEFGINNPSYILELDSTDRHERIIFGDTIEKTGEIYALCESTGDLVTFFKSHIAFLENDVTKYLFTIVHYEDKYDVSKVDIKLPDENISIEISGTAEDYLNAKYYYNGIYINSLGDNAKSAFESFYNSIAYVYFESIDPNGEPPDTEPYIEFIYTRKEEPKTVTVSYIQKSENTFYALVDGEYTGYIVRLGAFYEEGGIFKTKDSLEAYIN